MDIMHDVYNNVTPSKISNLFTFTSEIHTYNTRSISSEMYHVKYSLLCIISKLLESCGLNKLRDHMMQLINRSQHGFIPGRSCTTQLIETLDHIGVLLDSGKQIDIIFMDM